MKDKFVPAPKAYKKLKNAYDTKTAVYMFGATGFGKTTIIHEVLQNKKVLWLSFDEEWELSSLENTGATRMECVVIDDLQMNPDNEKLEAIYSIMKRSDLWVVLIGRMQTPQWLFDYIAEGRLMVVSEDNLFLSETEIRKIAQNEGVELSEEALNTMVEICEGNAYIIAATLQLLKSRKVLDTDLQSQIRKGFAKRIETHIIPNWRITLQEFLMKLSVVDEFTLPMAVMITGDDQAASMLDEAMNVGNFLMKKDDVYKMREILVVALRNKALMDLGLKEYQRCQENAGLYYETQGDIINAIKMYEGCGRKENIRSILIRNGRRHPGAGYYFELKKYYMALSEEEIESSPVLMNAVSLLYSILMNGEQSEYWYNRLKEYVAKSKGAQKKEAEEFLFNLDISLPHRGSGGMLELLKHTIPLVKSGKVIFPQASLTNNDPSLMNGGMDFCEWSKKDRFIADTLGKPIEKMLGPDARGLVHVAMAESLYEKGDNDTEAIHHIMLGQLEIEGGGKLPLLFVAMAIHIRHCMITGDKYNAFLLLDSFEARVRSEENHFILQKLEAFKCRLNLMTGRQDEAKKWFEGAPDELTNFCTLDRYNYITKILCYIELGKNKEALFLADKMDYYASYSNRTYYSMEIALLRAILNERENKAWEEDLVKCLVKISEYKFVRIVSEKGAGILPLLLKVKKAYLSQKGADSKWFSRVLKETESVADKYPAFLNRDGVQPADFRESSLAILKMQAEGLSIREIAEKLDISERTAKYHAAENYKKLNAKGKTDAVQIARSMNLI